MDSRAGNNVKHVEEAMKKLKIDPPPKSSETIMSGPKDGSSSDVTSCISSVDATASSIKGSEVDQEAFLGDHGLYCYGYCYPGFNGSSGEWDNQSYYMPASYAESQPYVAHSDNGSLMYYVPNYQAGYSSYNHVVPGAVLSSDGQYMSPQTYYTSPNFQQSLASPAFLPQVSYGPELVSAYGWDSSLLYANGYGYYENPIVDPPQSQNPYTSKMSAASKSDNTEIKESMVGLDVKVASTPAKQSLKPVNKVPTAVNTKGFIPVNNMNSHTDQVKAGVPYPNNFGNSKESGRNYACNQGQGLGDCGLNEQNRGPRVNSSSNSIDSVDTLKNDEKNKLAVTIKKELYNLPDFTTKYDQALFFVIKSYSEDDIHKSIKYNVWASTPNGNRKLDHAFQLAQEKMTEKGSKCPVFLFFSVNASGQFCGVAEMLDRVDFNKSMKFWQQDKWNGFFPVKWHIIKDVPNPQFRHILLENNENKPVTNSRDTQEVKFPQGSEMLNIFKKYSSKTSILDDFDFYENRQKVMQHKRAKNPVLNFGSYQSPKIEELAYTVKQEAAKSVSGIQQPLTVEAEKVNVGGLVAVDMK